MSDTPHPLPNERPGPAARGATGGKAPPGGNAVPGGKPASGNALRQTRPDAPTPVARPRAAAGSSDPHLTVDLTRAAGSSTAEQLTAFLEHTDFALADSAGPDAVTREVPDLLIGEYQIEALLGAGGMGHVFRAKHRLMDRNVALKFLPSDFAKRKEMVDRFFLEVQALGRLLHPNIVTAFDAGRYEDSYYLVMELVEGQSLSGLVDADGPLAVDAALDIIYQAAKALDYAHALGMIHRDVKPSNMMLTQTGQLKILDFGLVRLTGGVGPAEDRRIVGTVEYMSPEQVRRSPEIDHRTDLYSLGATLHYLLTGQTMFGGTPLQVALAHANDAPPPLYEAREDVDLRVEALFQRLVAKSPEDRFRTAGELVKYLSENGLRNQNYGYTRRTVSVTSGLVVPRTKDRTRGVAGQSTASHEVVPIGIDLGVLRSQAAFVDATSTVHQIWLQDHTAELENVLWSDRSQLLIGQAAVDARSREPQGAIYGLQQYFHLTRIDRPFCDRICPPEVVLAALLQHVAERSRTAGRGAKHAVLTAPACYGQRQRAALINAGRIGRVEILQLLDKHLAAALASVLATQRKDAPVDVRWRSPRRTRKLVVTLAGYAAEAAVVEFEGDRLRTLGYAGSSLASLLRWQARLGEVLAADVEAALGLPDSEDVRLAARLQRLIEQTVQRLFTHGTASPSLELPERTLAWSFTIEDLLRLCSVELKALQGYVAEALAQAGVAPLEIDEVVRVGPWLTSKTALAWTKAFLPDAALESTVGEADLAAAAAWHAHFLLGDVKSAKLRVVPRSSADLAVAVRYGDAAGAPRIVVSRNSELPHHRSCVLNLQPSTKGPVSLQFLENTRSTAKPRWNIFATVPLPGRTAAGTPGEIRPAVHLDSSGVWSASLHDESTDEETTTSRLDGYTLDEEAIATWRKWLETARLCSI